MLKDRRFTVFDGLLVAAVIILAARGAIYLFFPAWGYHSLHEAAQFGSVRAARYLIQHSDDVNTRDKMSFTPLHYAAQAEQNQMAMPRPRKGGRTIPSDDYDAVAQLLITYKANVNARDKAGRTPLHFVMHDSMVCILVDAGADVDARDDLGQTPLHSTFMNMFREKYGLHNPVSALIEAGADVNAEDKFGHTALHKIADWTVKEDITLLLEKGAKVNVKNKEGRTPLHFAVCLYDPFCMEQMLKHGANPNARDNYGQTPLHMAAGTVASLANVRLLVDAGADINIKDNEGKTPLATALEVKQNDIAAYLRNHGAKH